MHTEIFIYCRPLMSSFVSCIEEVARICGLGSAVLRIAASYIYGKWTVHEIHKLCTNVFDYLQESLGQHIDMIGAILVLYTPKAIKTQLFTWNPSFRHSTQHAEIAIENKNYIDEEGLPFIPRTSVRHFPL